MKFKKDELRWGPPKGGRTISDEIIGHGRWSVHHEHIFEFEGKFYRTTYSIGATESQDESPYDYEPDEIECEEVFPVEKVVFVYEPRKTESQTPESQTGS